MTRYRDGKGREWQLVRRLPFGSLELFDESRKRFMTVNSSTAKSMFRVAEHTERATNQNGEQ